MDGAMGAAGFRRAAAHHRALNMRDLLTDFPADESIGLAAARPVGFVAMPDRFTRLSVLALVIGLHVGILALLLLTRLVALPNLPGQKAIEIALSPSPPKALEILTFKPLPAAKINLPVVPPPEIVIETPAPSPIAVAVAASPVASPVQGNGTAPTGGDDYLMRLHTYLNKFMRCPILSARLGQQGTAIVHFVMDAENHVTKVEITKSSGVPAIDEQAIAVIRRAEPLPPVPPDRGPGLNAQLPVSCAAPSTAR
jgi:periplasmic protein TonB